MIKKNNYYFILNQTNNQILNIILYIKKVFIEFH